MHEFGDDTHVAWYRAGAHVEQNIGVEDATHDLHLFSEGVKRVLVKILSVQDLDSYFLRTATPP